MIGSLAIFETLNAHGVRYIVIGGMAQTLQGIVIKTDDVDICPAPEPENLEKLAEALNDLQAKEWDPHKGKEVERAWSPEMLQADRLWILRTRYGALDLLFRPAGTGGYEELRKDADLKRAKGIDVPTASINSIIEMKEASGRPKDREHLLFLYRLRRMLIERGELEP